jgi:hypothetical protein
MADHVLNAELAYFKLHQQELVEKYEGKFLIIKNMKIQGVYGTEMEAYSEAKKKFQLGTFLIQRCLSGEDSYTQTFHSRVVFH